MNWRKSTFSFPNGKCVEVAGTRGAILVRDSKDAGLGPVLRFAAPGWERFTREAREALARHRTSPACPAARASGRAARGRGQGRRGTWEAAPPGHPAAAFGVVGGMQVVRLTGKPS